MESVAHKKNLLLKSCQGANLLELLPYHQCDTRAPTKAERLKCLLNLQIQHVHARFAVFLTGKLTAFVLATLEMSRVQTSDVRLPSAAFSYPRGRPRARVRSGEQARCPCSSPRTGTSVSGERVVTQLFRLRKEGLVAMGVHPRQLLPGTSHPPPLHGLSSSIKVWFVFFFNKRGSNT